MLQKTISPSKKSQSDNQLSGRRIGFYTSVVGMGGSEVMVADAITAAVDAGASVVCWCEHYAAIRNILSARNVEVTFADWPHWTYPDRLSPAAALPGSVPLGRQFRSKVRKFISRLWRLMVAPAVKTWAGFYSAARDFEPELRDFDPHLLFVNVNGSEAVAVAGAKCGVPLVNCYHLSVTQPNGSKIQQFLDWSVRRATMSAGNIAIHVSCAARDEWCKAAGYPLEKTRIIYNGIGSVDPVSPSERAAKRQEIGIREGSTAFCVPGRLHLFKGHTHLITAFQKYRDALANCVVIICGEGDTRAALEQQVAEAGLSDQVRFLGWRTDLSSVLQASDCVVLPSVASENLSIAVIEGLIAGIPAIVCKVGGMAEAVLDGETGFVVPPADSDALGKALVRMAASPEQRLLMGERARRDAQERFTRQRMQDDYVHVFAEIIEQSQKA